MGFDAKAGAKVIFTGASVDEGPQKNQTYTVDTVERNTDDANIGAWSLANRIGLEEFPNKFFSKEEFRNKPRFGIEILGLRF